MVNELYVNGNCRTSIIRRLTLTFLHVVFFQELPQECVLPLRSGSIVDALAPQASRTLYVGGLERRTSEEWLMSRYSQFGQILDIGIKFLFETNFRFFSLL